jgi:hypothetical protein
MADATKKTAAAAKAPAKKAAAKKPAARKAPAALKPAAESTTVAPGAAPVVSGPKAEATATIKLPKGQFQYHDVDVQHNGRHYKLARGKELEVNAGVMDVLKNSDIEFDIITPLAGEDADEGSSASSTLEPHETALPPADETQTPVAAPDEEAHTLTQAKGGEGGKPADATA